MSTFIIERAPAKELIPLILDRQLYTDVVAFYKMRVNWYPYPLIHDGDVTYGLFDDLISQLDYENRASKNILQFVLRIVKEETDQFFLNALYFLHDLCTLAGRYSHPSTDEIEAIVALHQRVQRFSFLPNITLYWERIVSYLEKDASFRAHELEVKPDDYKKVMDLNFAVAGDGTAASCPKTIKEIIAAIHPVNGRFKPLHFIRSAVLENDQYWLWLYENEQEDGMSWYVTVTQNAAAAVNVRKHLLLKGLAKTPERLLLDCHYLQERRTL